MSLWPWDRAGSPPPSPPSAFAMAAGIGTHFLGDTSTSVLLLDWLPLLLAALLPAACTAYAVYDPHTMGRFVRQPQRAVVRKMRNRKRLRDVVLPVRALMRFASTKSNLLSAAAMSGGEIKMPDSPGRTGGQRSHRGEDGGAGDIETGSSPAVRSTWFAARKHVFERALTQFEATHLPTPMSQHHSAYAFGDSSDPRAT